jgi:hypothetical protein
MKAFSNQIHSLLKWTDEKPAKPHLFISRDMLRISEKLK